MRPFALTLLALLLSAPASAQLATERYAPAQLGVARSLLEQARAHVALGELARAEALARQASFDARLAWRMTESEQLRAEAAQVGGAAAALAERVDDRR